MGDIKKTINKSFMVLVHKKIKDRLIEAVEEIKEIIISEYDDELVGVVTDRNSKTNPNLYRDEFINRLNKFNYLEDNSSFSIRVPTMANFDFSGRLRVIETIMEGVSGIYVEVNEEDYIKIFGKKPINEEPVDRYVTAKDRIYLERYDTKIRKAEIDLNKKFVRYPFSNSPPIRIFDAGERFVDKNIDNWIEEAINNAQREFVNNYKGAHF